MDSNKIRLKLSALKLLNIALITLVFSAGWIFHYNNIITWSYQYKGNIAMSLIFLALYCLFVRVYDAFAVNVQRNRELAISQAFSAMFTDGIMYVIICLLYEWFAPVWPLVLVLAAQSGIALLWVVQTKKWYYRSAPSQKKVLLYEKGNKNLHLEHGLSKERWKDTFVTLELEDCLEQGMAPLEDSDAVYLCAGQGQGRDAVVEYCTVKKINLFIVPATNDMFISSARQVHLFHIPLLQMHMGEPSLEYLLVKRAMDIALSLTALILLSPFMLLVAIVIRAYDGGPAFYKQVRLTKGGKEFQLIKFRSMRVDAEADGVARLSTGENDDRITPVGRVLRKLRMDELPQILNILAGSMSVVGPRPERPEIAAQYEEDLPEFRLRLQAKAGLTGYAQVYGKYNSTPREKLQMDMIYISNPSIFEDIKLILTTLRVLFIKESTEGFESEYVKKS